MNFWDHITLLTRTLREHDPPEFSSTWLLKHAPASYRFICKNVRTEIDDVDWDRVTVALPRRYQKRWMRYRRTARTTYENRDELDRVLGKYRDKLYVFIASSYPEEKELRHSITVALVRLSQRGNALATKELVDLLRFLVEEWIDRYFSLRRWRGAESEIDRVIEGCIRRYRYTGTFFGYLFKTLEYSAYGLRPLHSLDDYLPGTGRRRAEVVGQDPESGETQVYGHIAGPAKATLHDRALVNVTAPLTEGPAGQIILGKLSRTASVRRWPPPDPPSCVARPAESPKTPVSRMSRAIAPTTKKSTAAHAVRRA